MPPGRVPGRRCAATTRPGYCSPPRSTRTPATATTPRRSGPPPRWSAGSASWACPSARSARCSPPPTRLAADQCCAGFGLACRC